jgi:intracellular multiplication protein IcmB
MPTFVDSMLGGLESLLAWISNDIKQTVESYCDLETADNINTLVARDGSLLSIVQVNGVTKLIGSTEFDALHYGISQNLRTTLKRPGQALQVYFHYDREKAKSDINDILNPAMATAKRLNLNLDDLFKERITYIARYCAHEELYFVLWTRPHAINADQLKRSNKDKLNFINEHKLLFSKNSQNLIAAIPDLRETHLAFAKSVINDLTALNINCELLKIHDAVRAIRTTIDDDITNKNWQAVLPGDKIPIRQLSEIAMSDLSGLMYPPLARQVCPRDAEVIDLRTVRVGDLLYAPICIELFPQEIKPFMQLMGRTLPTNIPWRISFLITSGGLETLGFKSSMASILAWTASRNALISDATNLLKDIELNTDEAVVKLQVTLTTWAPEGNIRLLRTRVAELTKAVEGWGNCQICEVSGDVFAGLASSFLGFTVNSIATPSVAPLSDVVYMLPFTRPASSWKNGAILFRSPDGKPWPYQPGSSQQTTWIDLIYARPGSGKSVLSNSINLALCLSSGIQKLPYIAIIDIGPSSSGLISLLREALPPEERYLVAYHRLIMAPEYAINPCDTQLGCRLPNAPERAFLVNFITLLATPLGMDRPYDGVSDMAGLIIDELYKQLSDQGQPHQYTRNLEPLVDDLLDEMGFIFDEHTTWWEVTDALFIAGFQHEAMLSQRFAMPILADITSICRSKTIEDL